MRDLEKPSGEGGESLLAPFSERPILEPAFPGPAFPGPAPGLMAEVDLFHFVAAQKLVQPHNSPQIVSQKYVPQLYQNKPETKPENIQLRISA